MSRHGTSPIVRGQVVGVSVFGAIAVITFLISLVVTGSAADTLRVIAFVAAGVCAIIGVSFAITRGSR